MQSIHKFPGQNSGVGFPNKNKEAISYHISTKKFIFEVQQESVLTSIVQFLFLVIQKAPKHSHPIRKQNALYQLNLTHFKPFSTVPGPLKESDITSSDMYPRALIYVRWFEHILFFVT
jgi:hypothetical protein